MTTEREVQAQLHPHSGQVEVQSGETELETVLRKALANTKALKRALYALSTIALDDNLQGAVAKNALEEIALLMGAKPIVTYDHAGPDY